MDLIERLLRGTVELGYEDLNPRAVDATKRFLLDTFGVCAAAFTSPEAQVVSRVIGKWGGTPESTPWFLGEKVPAPSAAISLSVMRPGSATGTLGLSMAMVASLASAMRKAAI